MIKVGALLSDLVSSPLMALSTATMSSSGWLSAVPDSDEEGEMFDGDARGDGQPAVSCEGALNNGSGGGGTGLFASNTGP